MNERALGPWQLSFSFHLLLVGVFFVMTKFTPQKEIMTIPVEITIPQETQNLKKQESKPKVVLKSVNAPPKASPKKFRREVFGASRESYTDKSVSTKEAVEAKKGNTLAKEADSEILTDDDPTSLPAPTEEYLVSQMPSVLSEIRPLYPQKAKEEKIEGAVEMDILIDANGDVRQVIIVDGLDIFKKVAKDAMAKFKFLPAMVDGSPVAVKIRYTLRFELEY